MELISWKSVFTAFKFICITSAISMTIYCSYDYSRNADVSVVSYKEFHQDEESIYPQLELCVHDCSAESEMAKEFGQEMDPSEFERIYRGDEWNDIVLQLDMSKVQQKFKRNVVDTCLFSTPPTNLLARKCDEKGDISTFVKPFGEKCLLFHNQNQRTMWEATMWIKTSIFPNSTRPSALMFHAQFTFPQQTFYPNNAYKIDWPIQDNPSKPYAMYFTLSDIEVLELRDKLASPCHDWKTYDSLVMRDIVSTVGCRPFYGNNVKTDVYPNCTTKGEMKFFYQTSLYKMLNRNVSVPCRKLQKMQMYFLEEATGVDQERKRYSGIEESLKGIDSWFRITLRYPGNTYKIIKQIRAYSAQSLIGNAGGYVGLFVGYTIAELPLLLMATYTKLKNIWSSFSNSSRNKTIRNLTSHSISSADNTGCVEGTREKIAKLEQSNIDLRRQMKNVQIEWESRINRTEMLLQNMKIHSNDRIY